MDILVVNGCWFGLTPNHEPENAKTIASSPNVILTSCEPPTLASNAIDLCYSNLLRLIPLSSSTFSLSASTTPLALNQYRH